jgi:hypothetical protein
MLHEAVRIMTPTDEIAEDVLGACNVPEKPDGWISVKDRLPEVDEYVICFGMRPLQNEPFVEQGRYNEWGQWQTCDWDGCGGYEYFDKVTHWMPLPLPPKGV